MSQMSHNTWQRYKCSKKHIKWSPKTKTVGMVYSELKPNTRREIGNKTWSGDFEYGEVPYKKNFKN
jgi:hypothetical protein